MRWQCFSEVELLLSSRAQRSSIYLSTIQFLRKVVELFHRRNGWRMVRCVYEQRRAITIGDTRSVPRLKVASLRMQAYGVALFSQIKAHETRINYSIFNNSRRRAYLIAHSPLGLTRFITRILASQLIAHLIISPYMCYVFIRS